MEEKKEMEWNPGAESKQKIGAELDVLLKLISDSFEPAPEEECTDHFTTREIYMSLQDMYPADYSAQDVFLKLRTLDFKFCLVGSGIQYEWLLKRKERP